MGVIITVCDIRYVVENARWERIGGVGGEGVEDIHNRVIPPCTHFLFVSFMILK